MIDYSLILSAASSVIAASAFAVAYLNYRTSRKLPNENKIFEEKIKSYQIVIKALNDTAVDFIEYANEYLVIEESGGDTDQVKDKLNEELDDSYFQLEDIIYEHALLVPDEIVSRIYDYFELFDCEEFLEEMSKVGKLEQFEEKLNYSFDQIMNAMRDDLAFEKLDIGLKKRIGGRHYRDRKQVR